MQSQAFVAVTGMNGKVENRLVTIGQKTSQLDGEANLTFDGSTLALTGDQTISGNLTVSGTTTSISTTNTVIKDQLLELGNGRTGSASGDSGLIIERGSDANAAWVFDESEDAWRACTTTATGASTGDLSLTDAPIQCSAITASGVVTAAGFTIGSAVIAEAELETIDGVTAGTVAASKAVVVDANKDFTGARNITITGELDAGSLDVSGDADIDGTLEADAITVGGVALAASALTDTTNASNIASGTLNASRMAATQTAISSLTNAALVVGRDADNQIKFSADNEITFRVSGGDGVVMKASGEIEAASLDISGDVDVDGTLEADAITLGGVALAASATTDTTNAANIGSGTLPAARMAAAQTAITSVLATDLKVGEDDQTKIDFGTADAIEFHADNAKRVTIDATGLTVGSGAEEDTKIIFDGHSGGADFRIGIDDSTDTLEIGKGTAHGTDAIIKISATTNLQTMINSGVADGEFSGTIAMFTANEDLTAGEVVFLNSSNKMAKAVATSAASARAVAMCVAPVSANAMGPFLLEGFARFDSEFGNYSAGQTLFTPEAETNGKNVPENAAPDTDGDFVQVIGFAMSAGVFFKPGDTVIEVA